MANYSSYADFNNATRLPVSNSRILAQDSLQESVEHPFLSQSDWQKGENSWEGKTKSRERSLVWQERRRKLYETMRRGNNTQRLVFGFFAFCCA